MQAALQKLSSLAPSLGQAWTYGTCNQTYRSSGDSLGRFRARSCASAPSAAASVPPSPGSASAASTCGKLTGQVIAG